MIVALLIDALGLIRAEQRQTAGIVADL